MSQSARITGATAAKFATERFGGPTRLIFRQVTLANTRQEVLGNNPRRVNWMLVNRNSQEIGVWFDWESTVGSSILIPPNGGFVSMDVETDGEAVTLPVIGVTGTGGLVILALEVVRV